MHAARSVLILAGCALALSTAYARADEFEGRLRSALGISDTAQLNWPPRSSRAAALPSQSPADRKKIGSAPVEIDIPAKRLGPPEAFWEWRTILAASNALDFKLVIRDATVEDSGVNAGNPGADNFGTKPARIWRGALDVEVRPKAAVPRDQWNSIRNALADAPSPGLSIGANSIKLALPNTVIATDAAPYTGDALRAAGRTSGPKRWALATIASGRYERLADMNQPWNRENAALVQATLDDWKPGVSRRLSPQNEKGILRNQVLDFIDEFTKSAKAAKAELLVVYYIGHMERTRTGSLSLLMGDAPPKRDSSPPAPEGFSNLRELAQIIDQTKAELAPDAGTLDVAVLHRRIGKPGMPFVLLVDGCLQDEFYATARERLGILVDARGGKPVYIGPGNAGTALRTAIDHLSEYSKDYPWLRSRDATILGATPGTLAYSDQNPYWLLGAPVAPIASRLAGAAQRTRYDKQRPNLVRLLNWAADRQSIGPQELTGTVSWSNWLPYLRRFDPASFK